MSSCLSKYVFKFYRSLSFSSFIQILHREHLIAEFRAYEKAFSAYRRNELDIYFLQQCKKHNVFPKFIQTGKVPSCLSNIEKDKIRSKVLNRKIFNQKDYKNVLCQKLFNARKCFYTKASPSLFHICIHWITVNIKKIEVEKLTSHDKKMAKLLLDSSINDFKVKNTVINLTKEELTSEEQNILKLGLNHGIQKRIKWCDIQTNFEELFQGLVQNKVLDETDSASKAEIQSIARKYFNRNKNVSESEHKCLINLKKKNIRICPFDKGNGTVIMSNDMYFEKMKAILNKKQFSKMKLRKNALAPNIKIDEKFDKVLAKVKNSTGPLSEHFKSFRSVSSLPSKLYGLPKVHKNEIPMRPILSTIGSMNHAVAKVLDRILKPLIKSENTCKDTFSFVEKLANRPTENKNEVMVSFDVESLFTMVPLEETIQLCCSLYRSTHGDEDVHTFEELLNLCVKDVPFLYNEEWWMQNDGVSMGSPLAPTMANIFMNSIEEKMKGFTGEKPSLYTRYVDDTFMIFSKKDNILPFFQYVNKIHKNIRFTMEEETDSKLPFLDVLVKRNEKTYETRQYFKATDTGLYTTPYSHCDERYKINIIESLISRAWRIASSYKNASDDIAKNCERLKACGYKERNILKVVNKTISKEHTKPNFNKTDIENKKIKHIMQLPYGNGYKSVRTSLNKLIKSKSEDHEVLSIFQTNKVGSYFSNKCKTPKGLNSNTVYKFKCHGCDAQYIGETERHLRTRCLEHFQPSRDSAIVDHLLVCPKRNEKPSIEEFSIVCKAFKSYKARKIYEAIKIKEQKPNLNDQKKEFGLTLLLF